MATSGNPQTSSSSSFVTHTGRCHCGKVQFEVDTIGADIIVWDCNCSICSMKRNIHFIVPGTQFRLLTPLTNMTKYQFNTKVAQHYFCSTCGVQAYYHPRSNPTGIAITVACIQSSTIQSITTKYYDGQHWETAYEQTNIQNQTPGITNASSSSSSST